VPQAIRVIKALPGPREWSRPEHDVNAGVMTLADDKRPEATLLIAFSEYAVQCQTHNRYELTCQVLRWHCVGWSAIEFMKQAK
jgi:hypothetical protein